MDNSLRKKKNPTGQKILSGIAAIIALVFFCYGHWIVASVCLVFALLNLPGPKGKEVAGMAERPGEPGSITKDATPEATEPTSITVPREDAVSGTNSEKEALIAINKLVEDLVKAMQIIGPKVEDLEAKLNLVMAKLEMK